MTFGGEGNGHRLEETKRISRVLNIVHLIGAQPRRWTRARLAGRFEVSPRTIDNDLQLIRHGLRYELRRTRDGYCFERGPEPNAVSLSLADALALALAAQQARDTGTLDAETVANVIAGLEAVLPPAILPYLRRAAAETAHSVIAPAAPREPVLLSLRQAEAEGRRASIVYHSASRDGAPTTRTIAPYALLPYDNSWQIVAQDSLRNEVRMFKVDRIDRCQLTDERYAIPADFDLEAYLGSTWGVLRGASGSPVDITLRFTRVAAAWVRDERWHPSQQSTQLPDGGILLGFHCGVSNELVRWILGFGGEVYVVQPSALRAAVVREAARVMDGGR